MPRVYIETTIPSLLMARPSRDIVLAAKQEVTREWWDRYGARLELYTSEVCRHEASLGDREAANKRLAALEPFPILALTNAAEELTGELLKGDLIPSHCVADAMHIAIATVHQMDILLT